MDTIYTDVMLLEHKQLIAALQDRVQRQEELINKLIQELKDVGVINSYFNCNNIKT